jgi:hypothetical protein
LGCGVAGVKGGVETAKPEKRLAKNKSPKKEKKKGVPNFPANALFVPSFAQLFLAVGTKTFVMDFDCGVGVVLQF